jgi:hypothetical protein
MTLVGRPGARECHHDILMHTRKVPKKNKQKQNACDQRPIFTPGGLSTTGSFKIFGSADVSTPSAVAKAAVARLSRSAATSGEAMESIFFPAQATGAVRSEFEEI